MADSNNIQNQIDLVQADLSKWSAELMRLNGVLATAKGRVKNQTQRAIKNCEQFINDLTKRLKRLDADLQKSMKTEVKEKDNILLAEKGIDQKGNMISGIATSATAITQAIMGGSSDPTIMDKRKSTTETDTGTIAGMKPTTLYIIAGAVVVLFLMMKKK